MGIDAGADIFRHLPLEQLRDADRELDDLETALDFALRVGDHLAVLRGDDGGECVDTLFADAEEAVQNTGATQRRRIGPSRESSFGGGDRGVGFRRARERDDAGLFAGCGIVGGSRTAARTGGQSSVDEVPDVGRHEDAPVRSEMLLISRSAVKTVTRGKRAGSGWGSKRKALRQ